MDKNPYFTENNDYDGVNSLDGSAKHPNKYELMEKRGEQIDEAIQATFKQQKDDILKRPVIGVVTLIRRELQKQGKVTFKSEGEQIAFESEYHTNAIISQLCKFLNVTNESDLADAIEGYYKK